MLIFFKRVERGRGIRGWRGAEGLEGQRVLVNFGL